MVYRQENEYPSRPCSKIKARPEPPRRYRIRAPSTSIQHSSMPEANRGKGAAASPRSAASTKSSIFPDNFFPTTRFYLSEHRLCSLHLGSFGSPFFVCHPEQTDQRVVILTEADGSRSDPSAKSKDPYPPVSPQAWQGISLDAVSYAAAFLFFLNNFFSTRIPLSTCFSSSKNGGKNLTTVSCVLLKSTPSDKASSTIGRAGISRLIPWINPRPRTSFAAALFSTIVFNSCCRYAPTLFTFSSSFSSSTIARNSSATRQANGPPPKVVPCCPGEIAFANSSFARNAPSGRPAAIGLAIATMSGVTPKL